MTTDTKESNLLVELDCLLDTRLAVLYRHDIKAFEKAMKSQYPGRVIDAFSGINATEFRKLYKKRDKSDLKNALGTGFVSVIKDFTISTLQNNLDTPFRMAPVITINTYPYDLTEKELELVIMSIARKTKELADVTVVNISPEDLTPLYIKSMYSMVAMYDYVEWLEIHSANGNLKKTTCPDIGLLAPELFYLDLPSKEEISKIKATGKSPFEAMEELVSPLIALKFMPAEFFSMDMRQ